MRITPTVWMSIPATVAVTAKRRIAPTAIRKRLKPIVMSRDPTRRHGITHRRRPRITHITDLDSATAAIERGDTR